MLPTSTRSVHAGTTGRGCWRTLLRDRQRAHGRRRAAQGPADEQPHLPRRAHEQGRQADAARGEQEVQGRDRRGHAEQHDGALRHRAEPVGALRAVRGVAEHRQAQPERAEDAARR